MWITHAAEPTYQQTMKPKKAKTKKQSPAPFVVQMPFDTYAAHPALNASSLKLFLDLPLKYKQELEGKRVRPQSKALELGRIIHSAVLEQKQDYIVAPETYTNDKGEVKPWNWNATYCKTWAAMHADQTLLTAQEAENITSICRTVWSDKWARPIIEGCDTFEGCIFADLGGRPCKIRMDGLSVSGRYIMDLKTCADASTRAIVSDCTRYNYYLQAAFYLDVAQAAGLDVDKFYFVFVEKSNPPLVSVKEVSDAAITYGRELYQDAIERLSLCQKTGIWPGYTEMESEDGQLPLLEPPAWVQNKALDELVIAGEAFMAD